MRTIFSKIAFSVALGLALTFTFSCSSNDSGSNNTAACKFIATFEEPINGQNSGEVCQEISGSTVSQDKQRIKKRCEEDENGFFSDSCPGGYVLKCKSKEHDVVTDDEGNIYELTTYFYGDTFKGLNCQNVN